VPLSFAQHRLWFVHRLDPRSGAYNMPAALRLRGRLDTGVLERCLEEVARRHESLRTVFGERDGEPVQTVRPPAPVRIATADLRPLPPEARMADARRRAAEEALRPFDLERGPLLHASLLRLGAEEWVLLFTMHHVVSDGWSIGVLVDEVSALYDAFARGEPSPLPELPVQYPDYALWQRRRLAGPALDEQLAFWRRTLAGAPPVLELPTDRPRPALPDERGGSHAFELPAATARGLRALARAEGATSFMVLAALFQALLARWSGRDDVSVGTPVAGRTLLETERLIGFFVNTLVLRTDLSGDPTGRELVARVRETVLAAQAHQDVPFERLVEELAPERSLQHTPLFQVMFTHQPAPEPLRLATLAVEPFATGEEPAKFDLELVVTERPDGGMAGLVGYRTALFDPATVRRLADHFLRLAAGLAADPARPVAGLPLAGDAEREMVLRGWNAPADRPVAADRPVHELLAERAALAPDAPAVLSDGRTLTHGELDRRADELAAALRRLGVRPEVPVAAFLERTPAMLVAVLACWKAGGVHVPLDPRYPPARLALVLADAAPAVVLAEAATAASLPPHSARVLLLDAPHTWPSATASPSLSHSRTFALSHSQSAYVIHTSGSTGRPKGVRVTHRSLAATLLRCRERFGLGPGDVMPCLASYAFDIWFFEALLPLLAGGATRVVPRERVTEPERLLGDLAGATALHAVPALMRQVAQAALASPAGGLAGIRLAFVGGDRVDPEVVEEMRAALPAAEPFVMYGPTEGTILCAAVPAEPGESRRLMGRPLGNARLYVLEPSGEPAPVGVPGEVCIGGEATARDYLGRPDLTAGAFVPDPFAAEPGARMYRSGDRARWGEDGVLEFLGRTDAQVKVRGFRVEPAEVEAALAAAPGVREAAVAVREDGPGGTRLVGYVAPEPGAELSADRVRASLRERLPDYMVPGAVVVLAAIPLTPTGKTDRAALPAPEDAAEHVEPRTPAEAAVARAMAEVLGVERVGADDDFFALGGHSLLATRVISRIRDALGVELPLRALFEAPTVAELAARVESLPAGAADPAPGPAGPEASRGPRPLSFAQQRLWFVQQLDPASAAYNMPAALRLSGRVDPALLRRCLGEVVRRHESLRTVFADAGGEPVQIVLPAAPARLPVADLRRLPPARRDAEAARLAGREALRPFDLERGPLLRSALLRLREEEWILLFTMHHVASDGWSMGVLVREVSALYEAFARGASSPLPELPLQYPDYAAWQRRRLSGAALEGQVEWWRAALAGAPATLDLPTDRPRPAAPRERGASVAFHLAPETSRAVGDLARAEGATPFMVLLAAWQALLGRWAGQDDVVVGTPVAGRGRTELEPLIGFFVNTLALRADLSGDPSLRALVGRVREFALGAFAHQEVPFERLVEELAPERSLSHTPLFQVMFALDEEDAGGLRLGGVWMEPVPPAEESVRFDLALSMEDVGGRLEGSLAFRADLFDAATARRLAEHLARLLDAAAAKPDRPLADVPLLGELERRRVLAEWNATARPYPLDRCVHDLFTEQAARTPDAPAVLSGAETLTYAELERRSAALARHLRRLGVGPETRVGLCLERTPELVVAVLAILRAGGAYLPLDPSYPPERLLYMLRDSGAPVLVTDSALAPRLAAFAGRLVRIDTDAAAEESDALSHSRTFALSHSSSSLAYVVYTSGSTGTPKGVGVEHRSLLNFLLWYDEEVRGPDAPDLPLMSRLSFDAHARQLFPPLLRGGPVWILSAETVADPDALLAALATRERVAFAGVPSLWAAVLERIRSGECAAPPGLVTVGVGGEALSEALAERTFEALPGVALWNHYGPTETTINAAVSRVRPGARVGIGRPVGNARAFVLDARLAPAPVGVPGELYVGGAGVARGYLGRPDLTAAMFVPDPLSGEAGARLYRTGDRVRWRADGELDYLGRVDRQAKVRGFRIEPGEVEAALAAHPEVREAAVVASGDGPGGAMLVGYVVPEAGAEPAPAEVRRWLGGRLPEYMVPSALVVLDSLPLTPAGKLDRRALPAPAEGGADAYVPPRTPTEERLAAVFAGVLKLERVGVHDDFFALGGHSLLATRVVARIRAGFGAEVPLRALFEAPTMAGLAERLDAVLAAGPAREAPPIVRVPRDGPLPLSFAQQRLWFLDRLSPGSAAYNLFYALRLRGPLDARALERALAELVRRHETLRTVFVPVDDGGVVQRVLPPATPPLPLVELAGLPEPAREAEVLRLAAAESALPFDLGRGPLLRATRLRLGAEEHALLFALPHVASDGWSMGVLVREVSALYEAFARGEASPLPELPVQYADFAAWQRAWPDGAALQRQLAYWRRRLAGAPPVLELPTDRPRPPVPGDRGGVRPFAVPAEVARGLRALARREGATLFATLLAGWQLLLGRWADVDDLVVGSPVAGRSRVELEGLIGFFATTLALRGDLSGDPTLRELVGRARETVLGAEAHQDLPFERLVEEVAPDRSLDHTPLFQVVFALQNQERPELRMGPLAVEPLAAGAEPAKFDLSLGMGEEGDRLEGALAFRAELFDAATVERLLERFGALLAAMARDPERRVSGIDLLLPDERLLLRAEWDASARPHPPSPPVHELAAAHARSHPDAPAVISAAGTLSHGELLRRADRLAGRLRALGVAPETRVAALLERGPEMPLAALAVLRAGGTVVPVDPANPPERTAYVLEQSGAAVLLTTAALAGKAASFGGEVVLLDTPHPPAPSPLVGEGEHDTAEDEGALSHSRTFALSHSQSAYVVYTSGSTGRPKGVVVTHGALLNLVHWHRRALGVTAADRGTLLAAPGFDGSMWELWLYLASGAALVAVEDEEVRTSPAALRDFMLDRGVTGAFATTPLAEALLALEWPADAPLRTLITGGDALRSRPAADAPFALVNVYGPTETTVVATAGAVAPDGGGRAPDLGRAVDNARAYLLDRWLHPVPPGAAGEVYVGGAGVSRGYSGRPGLTAERFLPDPLSPAAGARMYRTGDRARRRPDGTLEFLGRVDAQVKIRGFRVEPGEVEAVLAGAPGVGEAAVAVVEDASGAKRLAGYVVAGGGGDAAPAGIRVWLRERLPEYMVPSTLTVLAALPRSPNGKTDRRALPAPDAAEDAGAYVAPRTPTETVLAGIFAEVLGVERVGVHAGFFDLGGHSLLATRAVARIGEAFGVALPLRALFEAPTVAGLVERLDAVLAAEPAGGAPPIVRVSRDGPLPLSFAQQRLWFLDRLSPGSAAYNLFYALRLRGPLDVRALERALAELVRRHETLRTVFVPDEGGGAVQRVLPPATPPLPLVELAGLPEPAREAEARRLAAAESARPFDLERGPLLRATRVRLAAEEHALLFALHHVVSDGWSMGVLTREVSVLYEAFARGASSPLPELPVQYADYAAWQRRWLDGEVLARQLDYWRGRLAGAPPVLALPTDRPRPPVPGERGASRPLVVPAEVAAGLRALARGEGATLFATLLAGWQLLLARWADEDDVVVGSPIAGRTRLELEPLIGFFVNTLALRMELSGDPTLRELVGRARETTLGAFTHQDLPFERLVEEVAPDRSLDHAPLFQVAFTLHDLGRAELRMGPLAVEPLDAGGEPAKFDLSLGLGEEGDRLVGALAFRAELFDGATIERLLERFGAVLAAMAHQPERRVSGIGLLLPAERSLLRAEWDASARPRPPSPPVHELVARHARSDPGAPAVVSASGTLAYGDLLRRADHLAARLRGLGVGPETRVALCLERGPELAVAALAVLRAGGAYLPVDPAYPADRIAFLLEDSGAVAVLTTAALAERVQGFGGEIVAVDAAGENDTADPGALSHSRTFALSHSPDSAAYVVYTSGSTGRPKGVVVTHGALLNLVRWHLDAFGVTAADRATLVAGPGFDASVLELWPYLAAGAALHPVQDEEVRTSPAALRDFMTGRGATVAFAPTPLAEGLLGVEWPADAPLRVLLTGGDALRSRPAPGLPFTLFNLYGPAETAVVATAGPVAPADDAPDVGRAIDNARAYVLDRWLHPVPPGVPGELYVGGDGVARGYLGRAELTGERFLPDPFSGAPGARMYRTGDRVRRRPEGTLEFLGRTDLQVKIRGIRVEPDEVEAVLAGAPGVQEAAVTVRRGGAGEARLAGYVAAREGGEVAPAALRAWLRERLPEHMVPSTLTVLDGFPLTPNGKIDRGALPAPGGDADGAAWAAPRTPTEEVLAGIWAEVLGVDRVGAHAGFFDLGGHSLLATRVTSRIREAFGVELPLRALFEAPTVAGLAARVDAAAREGGGVQAPPLVPVPRDGPLPLSYAQQRLWFIDQLEPGSAAYNVPQGMRLRGPLDVGVLRRALGEIVGRHESLRTTFHRVGGRPVQVIHPDAGARLPEVDLRALAAGSREGEARRIAAEDAALPFDLARGPLLRAAVLRLGDADFALLLDVHHVVSDGWSMEVLVRELSALYDAFLGGRPSPLAPLPVQYADYAAWQRKWLEGPVLDAQLAWWRERLAGAPPVLELPTDRPRPRVPGGAGGSRPFALPEAATAALRALSRRAGTTLFMTLLAGWQALLGRYVGRDDVVVGAPVAGRDRVEVEGLIGFFVNTLVMRTDLSGGPDARELLRRVRETALGAYAHADVPFERLVEEIVPARSLSHTPLFQATFALQNAGGARLRLGEGELDALDAGTGTAKFDLVFAVADDGARLGGGLAYRAELWDAATVDRMLEHFGVLLGGLAAEPGRPVGELPLLAAAERGRVLEGLNDTRRDYPAGLRVHDLFAAQARRAPEAPAVSFRGATVSYAELDRRSARLANHLRRLGVGPETRVGICLERTPELLVAMLAVLRAGGAYVPLDPAYPRGRLGWMRQDAGVSLVLTSARLAGVLPAGTRAVALDAVRAAVASEPAVVPESGALPENLSHVIFTSGSTGRPKGVMIRHSSVVVLLHWLRENVSDEERAAALFSTSINFDVSVAEVFGTLCWGGRLVLVENALELAGVAEPVVHASMVPTAAAELLRAGGIPPGVRTLNLGGEPLPADLARALYALGTVERVGNLYGPTEDTTYSTYSVVEEGSGRVSLGRPLANTRALVLDAGLEPVPVGVPGELYLAGDGLARGYAARPDLTAERFLPDPFGPAGSRMYRVEDRVRWRADGELEYLGRTDFQVKVRGFRIEPGEIETALRAHPAVAETVAVVREDAPGDRRIAAYLVPAAGEEAPPAGELRAWLRERVPEYMVPSAFVALERLPLTPNGKLDRLALPAPGERAGAEGEYVAPRTPTEESVAAAWAATLGIGRVGAHDNFFDLGGHSLLLVQLHSRLQERFGAALSLAELFQHPTLADLARRLDELREEPAAAEDERRRTLDRAESRRARMSRPRPGRPGPAAAEGDGEEE
jgi:amino acid adenylation domain-containing protein